MSCDSGCNNCNNCNTKCNSPQCQSCQGCNSSESFCNTGSQLASEYINIADWGTRTNDHSKDSSRFLTAKEWNDFITSIYDAYCLGDECNAWGYEETKSNFVEYDGMDIRAGYAKGKPNGTEDFMFAKMYNGAIKKMRQLSSGIVGEDVVNTGDIIYASTFNDLMKYAKETFKLHENQCDNCNIDCDIKCNNCQDCDRGECDAPRTCCDDIPKKS